MDGAAALDRRTDLTGDGLLERFAMLRGSTIETARALDDIAWARAGIQATFGRLDAQGVLALAVDHDEEHRRGLSAG